MTRKKAKIRKEWQPKKGYFSWDTPEEEILGPDYKIRQERFYKSLANFSKDPDDPEIIDETLRLAQEADLDIWPEIVKPDDPYAHYTYFQYLLKGPKDSDHYLTVSKEIWGGKLRGHIFICQKLFDRAKTLGSGLQYCNLRKGLQ